MDFYNENIYNQGNLFNYFIFDQDFSNQNNLLLEENINFINDFHLECPENKEIELEKEKEKEILKGDQFIFEEQNDINQKIMDDLKPLCKKPCLTKCSTKITTKMLDENQKTFLGRKRKDDVNKGNHNKFTQDNIMRKIKSYFLTFCHNIINKSLKNKNLQFLKLNSLINENLKKDYNLKLLDTTFKELYAESEISSKYKKQYKESFYNNKYTIEKIYSENEETETIQILNLTYRDMFNIFRRKIKKINTELENKIYNIPLLESQQNNNINIFFEEVRKQEIEKNEPKEKIEEYIKEIKNLCFNYEEWFLNKKGRNRTKN